MKRKSNFELMRIVSMIMIIIWHLILFGNFYESSSGMTRIFLDFLKVLLVVHVNSFILLSGHFQCEKEFKFSKFLKLFNLIWFYKVIILLIVLFIGFTSLSTLDILKNLSPINYNDYWFLGSYLVLYLISPMLNKVINNSSKKSLLKYIIVIFLIVSILSTFTIEEAFFNNYGYSISNFILLYFIGAYIRKYPIKIKKLTNKTKQLLLIGGYLFFSLFNFLLLYFSYQIENINSISNYISSIFKSSFYYDNPFVIICSILFFLFFKNLNIKSSKVINLISSTVLGVYLIHNNKLLRGFVFDCFGNGSLMTNGLKVFLFLIIQSLLLFIICSLIELIRIYLFKLINRFELTKKIKYKLKSFIDSFGVNLRW